MCASANPVLYDRRTDEGFILYVLQGFIYVQIKFKLVLIFAMIQQFLKKLVYLEDLDSNKWKLIDTLAFLFDYLSQEKLV